MLSIDNKIINQILFIKYKLLVKYGKLNSED